MKNFSALLLVDLTDPTVLHTASPQAERIRSIGNGFLIAATGMFLLVVVLTVFITIKYRAKKMGDKEPDQLSGNRRLEILMVGVPLLLVFFFFFWSVHTMSAIMPPVSNRQADVVITGHQWWWQVNYKAAKAVSANEIHLPVGRQLLLELRSADVIHDWWVPSLGPKMDMIPGGNNYLWVTIQKPGIYEGTCSEFCGEQHAWMRITVIAQRPADFNNWLAAHNTDASQPKNPLAATGEALFMKASCSNCHNIRGQKAHGVEGPDLTHFASRQTMLSGMMANTTANVERWLTDPQKIKPGAHMPRFIFKNDSIRALTAYLSQLK